MDRQLLLPSTPAAALLAALALFGCAKSPPDKGMSSQAAPHDHAEERLATTHRPVIVSPETSSAETAAPPAVEHDYRPEDFRPSEFGSPSSIADGYQPGAAAEMPPAAAEVGPSPSPEAEPQAVNPLRTALVPPPPNFEPNPLRTPKSSGQAAPRIRSFGTPPAPSAVPESAPREAAPLEVESPAASPGSAAPPADEPATNPPSGGSTPPGTADDGAAGSIGPGFEARAGSSDSAAAPLPLAEKAPEGPYDIVQVFYGTDRAEVAPPAPGLATWALRFAPTGCAVLVTLCLGLIALAKRKNGLLWALAAGGVIVSGGLGLQASSSTLTAIRWNDKTGPRYGVERGNGEVQLGVCDVAIPHVHKTGELESPSILRLEVTDDLARHVALLKTERLGTEEFYEQLRARVAASPRQELFVFVHGFNVTFEDAARRTAQIHKDLKFPGAPIFYSWPANNKFLLTYPADENAITWSTPHFKQFLLDVVKHSEAKSINLIAHSMGNRALTVALREIELEFRDQARLFNHVVLAAPDIDAADFKNNIAPRMQNTARNFTLYASSRDDALRASQLLHRGPRAGDAGRGLVVVAGIDTIDVSAIDTSPWGHSYYGSSDPVLQDLGVLMSFSFPPQERRWLSPAELDGLTYWIFEPSQTARLPANAPR